MDCDTDLFTIFVMLVIDSALRIYWTAGYATSNKKLEHLIGSSKLPIRKKTMEAQEEN